jgi:DNA (cytosine-5)-methyltransferase 1
VRSDAGFAAPSIKEVVDSYSTPRRDVAWAIGDLNERIPDESLLDGSPRLNDVTRDRIEWLFDNEAHDLPDEFRPDCHKTKAHTYGSVYGRMHWDRPGPTITSGFNTMGQGRFVHPKQRRTITPHEAARIQFIPDFFDFSMVKRRNALTSIIGNAVPPKLSYVLGLELLR